MIQYIVILCSVCGIPTSCAEMLNSLEQAQGIIGCQCGFGRVFFWAVAKFTVGNTFFVCISLFQVSLMVSEDASRKNTYCILGNKLLVGILVPLGPLYFFFLHGRHIDSAQGFSPFGRSWRKSKHMGLLSTIFTNLAD